MSVDGEIDVRGSYCVLAVSTLLNLSSPDLTTNVASFIASCQSPWEGGFSALPGREAHGGYTFCALAALVMLDSVELIDLDALMRWGCKLQMSVEGGFAGRVNKLVDGCYTWWQGATCVLVEGRVCDVELYDRGKCCG